MDNIHETVFRLFSLTQPPIQNILILLTGKIYAIGGNKGCTNVECFEIKTKKWWKVSQLSKKTNYATTAAEFQGKIYLFEVNVPKCPYEVYDPATNV